MTCPKHPTTYAMHCQQCNEDLVAAVREQVPDWQGEQLWFIWGEGKTKILPWEEGRRLQNRLVAQANIEQALENLRAATTLLMENAGASNDLR